MTGFGQFVCLWHSLLTFSVPSSSASMLLNADSNPIPSHCWYCGFHQKIELSYEHHMYLLFGGTCSSDTPAITYDFSSCFFPKFKKSAKGRFSREMTYFFDFYGPKIGGGGSSYPAFVQKYQKP